MGITGRNWRVSCTSLEPNWIEINRKKEPAHFYTMTDRRHSSVIVLTRTVTATWDVPSELTGVTQWPFLGAWVTYMDFGRAHVT